MKRLDLIFSERELDAIIKTLEKAEVPGYTVMKHATGRGPERVVTEDMEFTGLWIYFREFFKYPKIVQRELKILQCYKLFITNNP